MIMVGEYVHIKMRALGNASLKSYYTFCIKSSPIFASKYLLYSLQSSIISRLGHCALLRYKQPSSPMLFYSKYLLTYLHSIIVCRLGHIALLRCLHPSSPMLFDSRSLLYCLHSIIFCRLDHCALLRCSHPSEPILFDSKYLLRNVHSIIVCRLGHCALLRWEHPSSPSLLFPKYLLYSLRRSISLIIWFTFNLGYWIPISLYLFQLSFIFSTSCFAYMNSPYYSNACRKCTSRASFGFCWRSLWPILY